MPRFARMLALTLPLAGCSGDALGPKDDPWPPAGFALVRDINPSLGGSYPMSLLTVGGVTYFSADDGPHGRELWRSDGTAAGTSLVKDVVPGASSSRPQLLGALGSVAFFAAVRAEEQLNSGLWATDGTGAGTVKLADLYAAGGVVWNQAFYFQGSVSNGDAGFSSTLWRSDGTAGGTASTGIAMASGPLLILGGALVFTAPTSLPGRGTVSVLWQKDGAGPAEVLADGYSPDSLVATPSHALFFASDEAGREPWISDGTPSGTHRLKDINPGSDSSENSFVVPVVRDGVFYFSAYEPVHGAELWRTDGTEAGTSLVLDARPGAASSLPLYLGATASGVYFTADDGVHGLAPWVSDGTADGTRLLKAITPGTPQSGLTTAFVEAAGTVRRGGSPRRARLEAELEDLSDAVFDEGEG